MFTIATAAKELGMSYIRVYQFCKDGTLKAEQCAGSDRWFIQDEEVMKLKRKREEVKKLKQKKKDANG